ncbi:MAG: imidazoleglycerol-phosphate dehydratase [Spirochaetaceae bacterium]|nr:imidazoleglycerol-phosphate dehydratase [Spirochaetaceae bacterium]
MAINDDSGVGSSGGRLPLVRVTRKSRETDIEAELRLEEGEISIATGIGFLDHLVTSLAYHAGWTLALSCSGDIAVDDHHSAEDCAIVLGVAFREALAVLRDQPGFNELCRFGHAYAPLDEALARAVVDLSGRPWASVDLHLKRESIGGLATENIAHFLQSFAMNAGITLHVDVLKGINDHHKAESAFKALALALRQAAGRSDGGGQRATPGNSTKGTPVTTVSLIGGQPGDGDGRGGKRP